MLVTIGRSFRHVCCFLFCFIASRLLTQEKITFLFCHMFREKAFQAAHFFELDKSQKHIITSSYSLHYGTTQRVV